MTEQFLLPEDVSAEDAKQVLDFLNQAASAEMIAETVELPAELDVGVRIAQRIINRRTELNGFRTIDEVYAVPGIGPERFTEIVVSLSSARPPRAIAVVTQSERGDLRAIADGLRSTNQPAVQARIWSVQDTIWLGQSATLLVQVNDLSGPLIDQPVTITTTWGELHTLNGLQSMSGNAVVARTNDVGLVELHLRVRFEALLSDAQRLALERAAGLLPPTAPWPTAASVQLGDLVQQYRAPGSDDLREAIDAAFREYARSAWQAEHHGQALAYWVQVPVSIVCFVNDEGDERGQRHLALATDALIVRNWLPAFVAAFEDDVAADGRLGVELKRARRESPDANDFLNDVFISVQSYLDMERGELGRTIRSRAAQAELRAFMQTDVAGLPSGARLAALTGVRDASKTIGEGGLTMFTAVDATRRAIDAKVTVNVSAFGDRLGLLERTAVKTDQLDTLRAQIVEQARAAVRADIGEARTALETRIGQLAETQAQLSLQIDLKADRSAVDTLKADTVALRRDVDVKADRAIVEDLAASNTVLERELETVRGNASSLRTDLNGLSSSVSGLNTRVTRELAVAGTRLEAIEAKLRR